jgi:subtilisin family serine protease
MKRSKMFGPKLLFGLLILVFFYGCQKSDFEQGMNLKAGSQNAITAGTRAVNFMIIAKTEVLPADLESEISAYGQVIRSIPEIGILVVKPATTNFQSKVSKLSDVLAVVPDLKVRWVEPLTVVEETNPPSIGDDETYFPYLWGMDAIDAPEAWNEGYKGAGARVFILDSGIDAEHPDISII